MRFGEWFVRKNFIFLFQAIILVVFVSISSFGQQSSQSDSNKAPTAKDSAASPAPATPSVPTTPQTVPSYPRPALPPGFDAQAGVPTYETIQEDWSSLAIGTSKLAPEKPLVAETDQEDTFTRILVQVKWRPGDPIDLYIMKPKGVEKPPVVLYLYGYMQDTDRFKSDAWASRVTGGGVAAVGFVSALTGQRFHDRPMKQWFVSELQESVGSTVHDIKFILDYLAERGDVDMNRVGMFGEGSGGAIAILAAAADPRIKAVDTLEPWGDWPDFLAKSDVVSQDPDRALYVKPAFLKKVAPLDPVKWLPKLTIPVRIQQIRQLADTPMECKEKIRTAAPKQAVVSRFETADDLGTREAHGRLFDWIKSSLPEPAKPATGNAKVIADKTAPASSGNISTSHQ
jgi:Acetyl xylan esterase (AXE1)